MRMLCWSECINNAPHYRNNGQTGSTQWHRHTPNYVSWAIRSTYHTILKAFPGTAIFGRDMLFDIPYIADWTKIGDYRQRQTDLNTKRENQQRVDYDYQIGDKILIRKDGILRKTESRYDSEPWTITSVHTNGTIRVERGTKSERINIRRVTPYFDNVEN